MRVSFFLSKKNNNNKSFITQSCAFPPRRQRGANPSVVQASVPNQAAKCAPNIPAFYTVYSPCEDPSRCSEAVPGCVNQSVCHHLITKNCLPGIMLIIHVFRSFGGVYPRDGAVVGGVKSQFLLCETLDSLINLDGREMWRFVLLPCPPFPSPSLFRSQ